MQIIRIQQLSLLNDTKRKISELKYDLSAIKNKLLIHYHKILNQGRDVRYIENK